MGRGWQGSPVVPHTPERRQSPAPKRNPTNQHLQSSCLRPCVLQSGDWLEPLKRKWPQHLTEGTSFSCVGVSDRGQNNASLCVQNKDHTAAETTARCLVFLHGPSGEPACSLDLTAPHSLSSTPYPHASSQGLAYPEVSGQMSSLPCSPCPLCLHHFAGPRALGGAVVLRFSSDCHCSQKQKQDLKADRSTHCGL